jgi:hypothetical protein
MKTDMLTTIQDEALEGVSGAGIGSAIGGAIDKVLSGAFNLLGNALTGLGNVLTGLGSFLRG